MNNDMPGMPGGSSASLNISNFNMSNETQAMDFLSQLLDDTTLQVEGSRYARNFWYGVVVFIGLAALQNFIWRADLIMRLRAAGKNRPRQGASQTNLGKASTAIMTISRKLLYPQFTSVRTSYWLKVPPIGTIVLIVAYLGFILALEFIDNDVAGAQYYTSLGVRAGWLAVAQVPLLLLLAGKNNLIGLVTGVSYERLNVLHRWVARGLLILGTLHMAILNFSWDKYGVHSLEWSTDSCVPTGAGAYTLLVWLNISTIAPFRNFSYDFFVIQHLITFFGFIVAIMYHLPSTALYTRVYIWIPIGLYLFDRTVRTVRSAWNNDRLPRATLEALTGNVTKVRVNSKRIKKWAPGSHVLLSIPRFGIGQSHPATILSIPESHDGDLVFILRAHKGFTKRILSSSNASAASLLSNSTTVSNNEKVTPKDSYATFIDGPYGGSNADFASFDTILLIAGSTGVTFTLALLLDIARRGNSTKRLPVRQIEFVWVVKSKDHVAWVSTELESAVIQLQGRGIDVRVRVFVTCSDRFTHPSSATPSIRGSACKCDKASGHPCCCERSHSSHSPTHAEAESPANSTPVAGTGGKDVGLSYANVQSGRPVIGEILAELLVHAEGETAVAACGPLGLNSAVRGAVAGTSSAKGVYLHVEGFAW